MKKVILVIFSLIAFFECFGQRFEVWIKTYDSKYNIYGSLGQFNDSVLTMLTGHLCTTAKIIIPLDGKTAAERNK